MRERVILRRIIGCLRSEGGAEKVQGQDFYLQVFIAGEGLQSEVEMSSALDVFCLFPLVINILVYKSYF